MGRLPAACWICTQLQIKRLPQLCAREYRDTLNFHFFYNVTTFLATTIGGLSYQISQLLKSQTQHHSLLHVTECSHLAHLQSCCANNAASVCSRCESSVLGTDPEGWP